MSDDMSEEEKAEVKEIINELLEDEATQPINSIEHDSTLVLRVLRLGVRLVERVHNELSKKSTGGDVKNHSNASDGDGGEQGAGEAQINVGFHSDRVGGDVWRACDFDYGMDIAFLTQGVAALASKPDIDANNHSEKLKFFAAVACLSRNYLLRELFAPWLVHATTKRAGSKDDDDDGGDGGGAVTAFDLSNEIDDLREGADYNEFLSLSMRVMQDLEKSVWSWPATVTVTLSMYDVDSILEHGERQALHAALLGASSVKFTK